MKVSHIHVKIFQCLNQKILIKELIIKKSVFNLQSKKYFNYIKKYFDFKKTYFYKAIVLCKTRKISLLQINKECINGRV